MLIGLDASRANRKNRSGVEWYAYHLIRGLARIDQRNQYVLYSDEALSDDLKPSADNFSVRVLKWPLGKFWTLGRMTMEMALNRPDLLFVPSHTFPFIGGKKNVITWHDVGYERYPETYSAWELTSLKRGAKMVFKMADKVITVSNFTKQEILNHYKVEEEKIKVIYLGCNHQRWRVIEKNQLQPTLNKYQITKPYFIYVGRLALRKNVIGLIRIYNRFREKVSQSHQLLLVGSEGPFQNELEAEIKASPFKDEIKKVGWLPLEELPYLVNEAEALVYPSIYEGFGLPAIEAMACGCPVIASTSGSLPEIVGDAGVLVDAHDVDGFAEAMIKVSQDNSFRENLISKGIKRSAEFTWEKCARQTLEVLESV